MEKKDDGNLLVTARGRHNLPESGKEVAVVELTVSVGEKKRGKYQPDVLSIARSVGRK